MSKVMFKKEFLTNLLSVRMLIIVIVFSSIVIGASYGISMGGQDVSRPEHILYPHIIEMDSDGYRDDLAIYYCDKWGNPLEDKNIKLLDMYNKSYQDIENVMPEKTKTTDKYGRAIFKNVSNYLHLKENEFNPVYNYSLTANIIFRVENQDKIGQPRGTHQIGGFQSVDKFNKTEVNDYFSPYNNILYENRDLDRRGIRNHILYHGVTLDGNPASNMVLYVNGTKVAESDKYGYIDYEFSKGTYNISVKSEYFTLNYTRKFEKEKEFPYGKGPDNILTNLSPLIILVLPIICIALAYDSVAKERETNSLFFLLVRPIKRWKIGLGKIAGTFSALTIPVLLVNSISIMVIWYVTGKAPSLDLIFTFFLGTLAIGTVFLSLQMIVSTISSSSGTAVLGGVGLWIYFNLFYSLIEQGITSLLGFKYGSYSYEVFSSYFLLTNPNMMFYRLMEKIHYGDFGLNYLKGIPDISLILSLAIWVIVSIVGLLILFEKKLDEG